MTVPLILTLALHPDDQARFDRLRTLHFPPDRNLVPAHVTLFHHLPGAELDAIQALLAAEAVLVPPFPVEASGLRFLGRGVAYELRAPELLAIRARLARAWQAWLTPQDAQGFRPHVTIQNKAQPEAARALRDAMQAGFAPFAVRAVGLRLWHYLGGPWELAGEHALTGPLAA
jgi:2'-5' RNA ligase